MSFAAHLRGAVHGAIHGRDGREVDDLHVAVEVRAAHDLARRVCVHAQHLAVAQVQYVAAVQLRGQGRTLSPVVKQDPQPKEGRLKVQGTNRQLISTQAKTLLMQICGHWAYAEAVLQMSPCKVCAKPCKIFPLPHHQHLEHHSGICRPAL